VCVCEYLSTYVSVQVNIEIDIESLCLFIHLIDSGPQIAGIESVIHYYQQRSDGLACVLSSDFVQCQPPPISARRLGSTNTLHRACKQGNFDIANKILSPDILLNRPDVNGKDAYGSTALHEASFFGHDDIVRLLIKAGAHVLARDTDGATALHRVNRRQKSTSSQEQDEKVRFLFRQQLVIVHRHYLF
jgi:hypothetical protein